DQAKLVQAGRDGTPITDGVFPEGKEFLAGFWIVDVETPERAYAIAARASAAPGPGGEPLNMPIEVRPGPGGPPPQLVETALRGPRNQAKSFRGACYANSPRRSSGS